MAKVKWLIKAPVIYYSYEQLIHHEQRKEEKSLIIAKQG